MSVKLLSRTAKERRPGSMGYAEAMLLAYNRKCKYPSNGPGFTRRMWEIMRRWTSKWQKTKTMTPLWKSVRNKQTDGSRRNRPFVILWPEREGGPHVFHRTPAQAILPSQLLPVAGYGFTDIRRRLLCLYGGQAEVIGHLQRQFQVDGVVEFVHIEESRSPEGTGFTS